MKRVLLILFAGLGLSVQAKDIETDAVLLQALDKTTGRTSFLTVKVGEPYVYGDLKVFVKKCVKNSPEETPENAVFMTVKGDEDEEIFQGWMFSSDPALSAMDHAVYDIWVLECRNKSTEGLMPTVTSLELDETDKIDVDSLED